MQFSADCSLILKKLPALTAVVPPNGIQAEYYIASVKNSVYAIGLGVDSFVAINLDIAIEESFIFSFAYDAFTGTIKGRGKMDFQYDGKSSLSFKSGRYSGSIPVVQVVSNENIREYLNKPAGTTFISKDILSKLKACLKQTNITDLYTKEEMPALIRASNGTLTVDTFDEWHVARAVAKVSKDSDIRLNLSRAHFNIIDKYADSDARFSLSDSAIRVVGSNFVFEFPNIPVENTAYEEFDQFLKVLDKPDATVLVDTTAFKSVMNNMFALDSNDASLILTPFEKGIHIKVMSQAGEAKDSIRGKVDVEKSFSTNFEPKLFKNSLSIIDADKVSIRLHKNRCALLRSSNDVTQQMVLIVCKT